MLAFAAALLACASAALTAAAQPPQMRLPDQVTPLRYSLEMTLAPAADEYAGTVAIELQVKAATRLLWINGDGLTIDAASLTSGGVNYPARARSEPRDFIALAFADEIPAGPATLTLRFRGTFALKETRGLFKQNEAGEWYVFTQFEPMHARRAFPCFDEPGRKTPWQIALKVRREHAAVANTPVRTEAVLDDVYKLVTFEVTRPLPTYLVAFAVGPFDFVDGGRAGRNRTALRYIVPKGRADEARYARAVTPRILEALEDYIGTAYPFEKLDSLVIPATVSFGAMENAGLITYAGNIMLAGAAEETIRFKQRYASIAAHELAHQWFGNLVTMAWWDDVWLNESFATWLSNKVLDRLYPEWQWQANRVAERAQAMDVDILTTARRIRQPVENRNDLANAFDRITYQKGASVLAMFEAWTGEQRFGDGVRRYLGLHAWGNATARDFVAALARDEPQLAPAFESFIEQAGIPLITVALRCEGAPQLRLSQDPFRGPGRTGRIAARWQVPVCVRYRAGAQELTACSLVGGAGASLALAGIASCPDWIMPDQAAAGYYRSRLAPGLTASLSRATPLLAVPEQVGFLDNAAALARNGEEPMADVLALALRLSQHERREVVESSTYVVGMLGDDIVPPRLRSARAQLIEQFYGNRLRRLGYRPRPADDDNTNLLRAALIGFSSLRGADESARAEMRAATQRWLEDNSVIDGLLVEPMLKAAAAGGDRVLFERLAAAAKQATNRRERGYLLTALGHFRDGAILQAALQIILADTFEGRDAIAILQAALANDATRRQAFDFMRANYAALEARLPREFTARFPSWTAELCTVADRDGMAAFFRPRMVNVEGGPRNLAQALERVDLCVAFKAAQQAGVAAFLERFQH